MAVVGPHLCGLGGDMLAMVAPPGSAPEALLGVGRAGRDPTRPHAGRGLATMPLRGDIRSVEVPGAVDGWLALHERYGRRPRPRCWPRPSSWRRTASRPRSCWRWPATWCTTSGRGRALSPRSARHRPTGAPAGHRPHAPRHGGDGRAGFYGGEFGRGLLDLGAGHFAPGDFETPRGRVVRPRCAPAPGAMSCGRCPRPRRAT